MWANDVGGNGDRTSNKITLKGIRSGSKRSVHSDLKLFTRTHLRQHSQSQAQNRFQFLHIASSPLISC